ncbi:MAG TPA: DUF4185 domain-containing protein [Caulifigura sp.]|nr:DUF4185 domain-containing protein [Caulifigura sp.]
MSRFALAPRALACVVGIALLFVDGLAANAQVDDREIGLEFDRSKPAPELNSRFRPEQGWIGGDGAQSVDLGDGRTLWLYGDTWVGTIDNGRRSRARIVRNSVGIQCAAESPCEFVVRKNDQGRAADFISPADGRGWLWFESGVMVKGRLYLFLMQADRPIDFKRPDHQPLAMWLAVVENPLDDPIDWCISQTRLPFAYYGEKHDVTFGCSTIVQGDHLYVYGTHDSSRLMTQYRYLTVARVPLDDIENFSAWRFQRKGRWGRDFLHAGHIADFMASELSVTHLPELDQYLMVYTDCDVSNRIVARTASSPAGPWSDMKTIHHCRDAAGNRNHFCYAGKAHPTLSSDGQLVVSYLTSSVDTWEVATDSRLYWPTFVTVKLRDSRPASAGTIANRDSGNADE